MEIDNLRLTLMDLGFKDSYARDAAHNCSDLTAALDWLCLHVPGNLRRFEALVTVLKRRNFPNSTDQQGVT
jgi:hypothetical protein